jgi:hypothetical protein
MAKDPPFANEVLLPERDVIAVERSLAVCAARDDTQKR